MIDADTYQGSRARRGYPWTMQGSQPQNSENQSDEDILEQVTKPVYSEGTKRKTGTEQVCEGF